MASALTVTNGQYQTIEGTPTRVSPDDDQNIPPLHAPLNANGSAINNNGALPPPASNMDNGQEANSFNFDK